MRYRWKLLILFLVLTLVPILIMRTFGIRAVRKLGDELVSRMSAERIYNVKKQLSFRLDSHSKIIWTNRKQIEIALLLQAKEVERCLAKQAPLPTKIYFAQDYSKNKH